MSKIINRIKQENWQVKDYINMSIAVLGLIISVLTLIKAKTIENKYSIYNEELEQTINEQYSILCEQNANIGTAIENVQQYVSTNIGTVNNNYGSFINDSMNEQSLLQYAEMAWNSNDYETVIQIYSLEKMQENPVVCTNLGYMYANGIHVVENTEIAEYYYKKAIEYGGVKAVTNLLAMYLKNCNAERIELLVSAIKNGNELVIDFISCHAENYSQMSMNDKIDYANAFCDLTFSEQSSFLDSFYEWKEMGHVYLYYSPDDNENSVVRHVWIDDLNLASNTVHIYNKYEYLCSGIEVLCEAFEKMK